MRSSASPRGARDSSTACTIGAWRSYRARNAGSSPSRARATRLPSSAGDAGPSPTASALGAPLVDACDEVIMVLRVQQRSHGGEQVATQVLAGRTIIRQGRQVVELRPGLGAQRGVGVV